MPKLKVKSNKQSKKSSYNQNSKQLSPNLKVFIKTQILFLSLNAITFLTAVCICLQLDLARENLFYICIISLCVGSFISSFYAGYKIHKNGLVIGFIFSLPINALVILISLITNSFIVDYTALISFFILMVTAMLAGILSVNITMKAKR